MPYINNRFARINNMSREIASWLTDKLKEKGWSMRELERRAGVSVTTISRVVSGETSPTWDFCAAIAGPLGETPIGLFRRAGLLKSEDADSEMTFQQLLEIAKSMTVEEREEVIRFALFMKSKKRE